MKSKKLLRGELIGKPIKIGDDEGIIIDETKHLLIVQTDIVKTFHKKGNIFMIKDQDWVEVKGELLEARPEDRIKRKIKQ